MDLNGYFRASNKLALVLFAGTTILIPLVLSWPLFALTAMLFFAGTMLLGNAKSMGESALDIHKPQGLQWADLGLLLASVAMAVTARYGAEYEAGATKTRENSISRKGTGRS